MKAYKRCTGCVAVVVDGYNRAIEYYTEMLDFTLIEDLPLQDKCWVIVTPDSECGCNILLAPASNERQMAFIGNQCGGRVFLFLQTDDFWRDYSAMKLRGVEFCEVPREEEYGTVVVFEDIYGNRWDLFQKDKLHNTLTLR
ncbi:VOC family protein [Enterobacter kobei]|uniref:VOC family protein n=1 Tax=Enterobacter kobei TaxID=208224 RepID=UPI003CF2EE14